MVGGGLFLIAGAGLAIEWVFRLDVFPISRIAEETGIMHGVNTGHRLHVEGSRDVRQLAAAINTSADAFEALHRSVEERIAEARARIEEEKNILSVVLAELPEGVLVCNPEGRIILYNERARQLLESPGEAPAGVHRPDRRDGRSGRLIFSAIDKPLIAGALDEIAVNLRRGGRELASSFVIAGRSRRLLQVAAVPILGPRLEMSAFALILTDATEQMEAFRQAGSAGTILYHPDAPGSGRHPVGRGADSRCPGPAAGQEP